MEVEETSPAKGLVGICVPIVVTILNVIGLLSIFRNKELEPRIKVGFVGHCVSDITLSLIYFMIAVTEYFQLIGLNIFCMISTHAFLSLTLITGLLSVHQAIDQVLVLRFPMTYSTWVTTKKMIISVVAIFVVCFLLGFVVLIGFRQTEPCSVEINNNQYSYILTLVNTCLCIISLPVMYIYSAMRVRSHIRHMSRLFESPVMSEIYVRQLKQKRMVVTLSIICGLYIVCYSPMVVLMIRILFIDWENRSNIYPNVFSRTIGIIYILNSAANPIVFIWRFRSKLRINSTCKCC